MPIRSPYDRCSCRLITGSITREDGIFLDTRIDFGLSCSSYHAAPALTADAYFNSTLDQPLAAIVRISCWPNQSPSVFAGLLR